VFFRNGSVLATIAGILSLSFVTSSFARHAELQPAPPVRLPGASDSNNPAHWRGGRLAICQSTGLPLVSEAAAETEPSKARPVILNSYTHYPLWIDAT